MSTLPLVSILIPTHNRPGYFELALQSALGQTYPNVEVVVSDNSESDETRDLIEPYLARDARLHYHRAPVDRPFMENWMNALHNSKGEFVNFLMDDDLFDHRKIERMVACYQANPGVGLVTSFRQLIDGHGRVTPPLPGTARLFETDTLINGSSFGDFILKNGMNMIGEPTTVLVRRVDIGDRFGIYCQRQYWVLSDIATWMSLMHGKQCAYLAEPLSSFRIHDLQDQRLGTNPINAQIEWLQLLLDSHAHGYYMTDKAQFREMLGAKLSVLVPYLVSRSADIRGGRFDVAVMQDAVSRAVGMLLTE